MSTLMYEIQPLSDGCLLKLKQHHPKIEDVKVKIAPQPENVKKPTKTVEPSLPAKAPPRKSGRRFRNAGKKETQTFPKTIINNVTTYNKNRSLNNGKQKLQPVIKKSVKQVASIVSKNKGENSCIYNSHSSGLKDIMKIIKEEECEEITELRDRQIFWEQMLSIGQWLTAGKNNKIFLAYERKIIEESIDNGLTNIIYLSPNNGEKGNIELKKVALTKGILKAKEDKYFNNDYNNYLYVDEILSNVKSLVPGLVAHMDLQALSLTVNELTETNSPLKSTIFNNFIKLLNRSTSTINVDTLNDKKNLIRDDWILIKDLYVEFRVKGTLEVRKVYDQILNMAARCYPSNSAKDWYLSVGCLKKPAALRLGTLFLNIFHVSYLEALKGLETIPQQVINNKLKK